MTFIKVFSPSFITTTLNTMTVSIFLATAFVALLALYLKKYYDVASELPRGPWGYPILGVLLKIKKEFHLFLLDLCREYGKMFSIRMGNTNMVVLSDADLIRKAFKSPHLTARPRCELSSLLNGYGELKFFIINYNLDTDC